MTYVFIDTNIFIHFQDVEQIDWNELLQSKDSVTITIAPIVISELDKHKYSGNKKISKRIKKILPKIEGYIQGTETPRYPYKWIIKRPESKTFQKHALSETEQDDSLLSTILEFSNELQSSDNVFYATNDTGPRLKCRSLGIKTINLPDSYLLAVEPDEVESENRILKERVRVLENKIPVMEFSFMNKSNFLIAEVPNDELIKDDYVNMRLTEIQTKYPFLKVQEKDPYKDPSVLILSMMPNLQASQIESYNEELAEFYKKYEKYFVTVFEKENFLNRSIKIELLLSNSGWIPADNIDVDLHFPDGFELFSDEGIPNIGEIPKPPYKPTHAFDWGRHSLNLDLGVLVRPPLFTPPDLDMPSIKKTNSYNVNYHFQSLKHNQTISLYPLYAKFKTIATIKSFQIQYRLTIGNVPNVIEGTLNVKAQKN